MQIVKKFRNKTNCNILEIHVDETGESPRQWDNLGTMLCCHSRYELGDKQVSDSDEVMEETKDAVIKLPLYILDHSGISMSTSDFKDPWDSGQVGIIFVNREKLLKEYNVKRLSKKTLEKAKRVLQGEVETYDQYLRGEVYGYVEKKILVCNLNETHEETVDSCWGFYGYDHEKSGILDNYKMDEWEEIPE